MGCVWQRPQRRYGHPQRPLGGALCAHCDKYNRLVSHLALTQESRHLAIVLQPMLQLHEALARVHGEPSPPDEVAAPPSKSPRRRARAHTQSNEHRQLVVRGDLDREQRLRAARGLEEFLPPSPLSPQTCTVRYHLQTSVSNLTNMQPSRAHHPSASPRAPRRPFRFTDVRLAKYQPLIERTQCMHHGNHGRPPR